MDKEMRELIVDELYDCDRYNGIDTCAYCKIKGEQGECTIAEKIAERLHEAGYSKSVKFEKREDFDKVVEENKNLKQSIENDFTFETTTGGKMNVLDMVKKQAVKEFAEKLKNKFDGYEATSYNGCEEGWHDLQEEIDEVCKEK